MLKWLIGFATLLISGLVLIFVILCVAVGGLILLLREQQRIPAAHFLSNELTQIDTHFNLKLTALTANLSPDTIFPNQVNKFTRESIESGNINTMCGTKTHYAQATYKTAQGTTIQIMYCLGTTNIAPLNTMVMPVYCGDLAGKVLIRETVKNPYLYGICPAGMFSSAEHFNGSITWANGEAIFSLHGNAASVITQFLRDYPY